MMAKISFERHNFAAGTVETVEREIDSEKVLAGNAFFNLMKGKIARNEAAAKVNAELLRKNTTI